LRDENSTARGQSALTLTELLVVIAITGILTALFADGKFHKQSKSAANSMCQ